MSGWLARLFRRGGANAAGGAETEGIAIARMHAEERLMAVRGVVSVGVGRDEVGAEAIVVGVAGEVEAVGVPAEVDGVPVVVRRVGRLRAEQRPGESSGDSPGN